MQEQNKNNAIFLGGIFLALLVVFFTVVVLRGVVRWWSVAFPLVAEGYGIYHVVKLAIKFKKESEIKKEEKK